MDEKKLSIGLSIDACASVHELIYAEIKSLLKDADFDKEGNGERATKKNISASENTNSIIEKVEKKLAKKRSRKGKRSQKEKYKNGQKKSKSKKLKLKCKENPNYNLEEDNTDCEKIKLEDNPNASLQENGTECGEIVEDEESSKKSASEEDVEPGEIKMIIPFLEGVNSADEPSSSYSFLNSTDHDIRDAGDPDDMDIEEGEIEDDPLYGSGGPIRHSIASVVAKVPQEWRTNECVRPPSYNEQSWRPKRKFSETKVEKIVFDYHHGEGNEPDFERLSAKRLHIDVGTNSSSNYETGFKKWNFKKLERRSTSSFFREVSGERETVQSRAEMQAFLDSLPLEEDSSMDAEEDIGEKNKLVINVIPTRVTRTPHTEPPRKKRNRTILDQPPSGISKEFRRQHHDRSFEMEESRKSYRQNRHFRTESVKNTRFDPTYYQQSTETRDSSHLFHYNQASIFGERNERFHRSHRHHHYNHPVEMETNINSSRLQPSTSDDRLVETERNSVREEESSVVQPESNSQLNQQDMEEEKYTYFFTKKYPFSNHYPCPKLKIGSKNYTCTEQYYMYKKAVAFKDGEAAEEILSMDDPKQMKQRARLIPNFDQAKWDKLSSSVMTIASEAKYTQNPELRRSLFETFGTTLVETNPNDVIWGIGVSMDDPRAKNRKYWRGKNLLGEILTQLRDKMWHNKKYKEEVKEVKRYLHYKNHRRTF